jgi:hypothetical protein
MSTGSKAGLIFIIPQLVVMIVATIIGFVPLFLVSNAPIGLIGCCVAPSAALILAGVAGYLGTEWDPTAPATQTGIMAGLISVMGALFGAVLFWVTIGLIITYGIDNATLEASLEQLQNLSVEGTGDITAVRAMLSMAVLFMTGVGVVSGLMSLSMSFIGGLIGAHLAKPRT